MSFLLRSAYSLLDRPAQRNHAITLPPKNYLYGPVNLVFATPPKHTPLHAQPHVSREHICQWQVFGGIPSPDIAAIVLRDNDEEFGQYDTNTLYSTLRQTINAVVANQVFIPVYRQSTGELLTTPEWFDSATRVIRSNTVP